MIYRLKQNIWITLGVCLLTNTLLAQDKYQSLLWEIKSEDLEEPSYLYGTMHVSSKLAFHLTDDFFESLEKVDIVALESDPTQWLSETEELEDQPMLNPNRFYRQFQHKVLDKYSLAEQLTSDHALINNLLYRSNSARQDFQEDTYLDMFIFQAGSRFNKEIVGLEDFKESRDLVTQAYNGEVVKDNPPVWLQDLLKEKSYDIILSDSYRNNDLDMIDSLNTGFNTDNYLEYMLFKRNNNMVEVYDSIIRTGKTIFAGVGAAHLPGDEGMIEAFRAKGYTVTPIKGDWTDKGKKAKEEIGLKRVERTFEQFVSSDGFIKFNTPAKVHEVSFYGKTMYLAPDLTNGSYVAVSRMKLNQFVNIKTEEGLSFDEIDKILIEYIPGEITSKKEIERNGIPGLDIVSKTKRGDNHRYAIFKTPLEFIIIKMIGKNEDVTKNSSKLFNSIVFDYSNDVKTIEPKQGGFTVDVPNFYLMDNNSTYTSKTGNPQIQAFNADKLAYYFVQQLVLNDNVYLEKDLFELNRIIEVYFKSIEIDSFNIDQDTFLNRPRIIGTGQLKNGKSLMLSAMIKGGHYYLMGSQGLSENESMKFFNSFKYSDMNYNLPFEEIIDTNLHYKVMAQKKANEANRGRGMYSSADVKSFQSETKQHVFNSISKQQVFLKYYKYNDYDQYENIDSLWKAILDYKINKGQIVEYKKTGETALKDPYLDIIMADTATSRKLKFKYIIHGGVQYKLSTVIDSLDQDPFVTSIFNTFQPLDTLIGKSPIDKKAEAFFSGLYSKVDSLESEVLENHKDIKFFLEDKDQLVNTIENWAFKDKDLSVKLDLIEAFSKLNTNDRLTYLSKWYSGSEDNANMQIAILNLLTKDGTKKSYKQLSRLLRADIPLLYQNYKINQMFLNLNENPELEEDIMHDLMSLLTIEEYKSAILESLSMLYKEDVIGKHFLKKYKKQLISMAKVEFKRARSKQIANSNSTYSKSKYKKFNNLLHLLLPFRHDDEVRSLYAKVKASDFKEEHIRILAYHIKLKDKVDEKEILELAEDVETRAQTYQLFSELDILDAFPKQYGQLDSIAQSYLSKEYLTKTDDNLEFYKKRDIVKDGVTFTVLYYKYYTTNYQEKKTTKVVYTIFKSDDYSEPVKEKVINDEFREDNQDKLEEEEERFKLENYPRVVFTNGRMYSGW